MISVVVVDDHWMVREGLRSALTRHGHIEVVGEASGVDEALAIGGSGTTDPDVVLLDARLGSESSLPSISRFRARFPRAHVLVVSMLPEDPYALRAIEAGADGFVRKDGEPDELQRAVEVVAAGESYVSPAVARLLAERRQQPEELTPREFEVVRDYAAGLRSGQIARRLAVSPKTVSTHKTNAMRKLGIQTNADLIRWASDRTLP